jgi:hypothetical protein
MAFSQYVRGVFSMDAATFNSITETMIQKSSDVLLHKQKEYATEDRLHNFKVAAAFQQCSVKQVLFGFLTKHLVSLSDMCKSKKIYRADIWDEKIGDSINYLLLLRAVVAEEGTQKN